MYTEDRLYVKHSRFMAIIEILHKIILARIPLPCLECHDCRVQQQIMKWKTMTTRILFTATAITAVYQNRWRCWWRQRWSSNNKTQTKSKCCCVGLGGSYTNIQPNLHELNSVSNNREHERSKANDGIKQKTENKISEMFTTFIDNKYFLDYGWGRRLVGGPNTHAHTLNQFVRVNKNNQTQQSRENE